MTKRLGVQEVHKNTEEKLVWCSDPHLPPCCICIFLFLSMKMCV
ncbi:hypothetical protein LINGRAHAP2_LOCUS19945 [Linum grandiflorum]